MSFFHIVQKLIENRVFDFGVYIVWWVSALSPFLRNCVSFDNKISNWGYVKITQAFFAKFTLFNFLGSSSSLACYSLSIISITVSRTRSARRILQLKCDIYDLFFSHLLKRGRYPGYEFLMKSEDETSTCKLSSSRLFWVACGLHRFEFEDVWWQDNILTLWAFLVCPLWKHNVGATKLQNLCPWSLQM